jgi:type VI protein secretion system component VasK
MHRWKTYQITLHALDRRRDRAELRRRRIMAAAAAACLVAALLVAWVAL